jgi:hypothetical protein
LLSFRDVDGTRVSGLVISYEKDSGKKQRMFSVCLALKTAYEYRRHEKQK